MSHIIAKLLKLYKILATPFLKTLFGNACRFRPTCSQYSKEAFEKYGIIRGIQLTSKRLIRCQPLLQGGYDPLPAS